VKKISQLEKMKPSVLLETLLVLKEGVIVNDGGLKCRFGDYRKGTLIQVLPPVRGEENNSFLYEPGQSIRPVEVSLNAEIERMFSVEDTPPEYIMTIKDIPILRSRVDNSLAA
jgi:hypothetical protein